MLLIINCRLVISIISIIFISTLLPGCNSSKCKQEALILVTERYLDLHQIERQNLTQLITQDLIESNIVKNLILDLGLEKNNRTLSKKEFLKNLEIKAIPNTNVISFYYINSNRENKVKIINNLVDDYVKFTIRKTQKEEDNPESIAKKRKVIQYKFLFNQRQQLTDSFSKVCRKILCNHDSILDVNSTSQDQLIELKRKFDINSRKVTQFKEDNPDLFEDRIPQSFSPNIQIIQQAVYPCPN